MNILKEINDWRYSDFDEIIDVRSPSEFDQDHILKSKNIPILSDSERAKVGTIYKQENPFKAKILGASLISKNISKILKKKLVVKKGSWNCLIYCWRGGQRSRSLALVLNEIGWRVTILSGGYKAYRNIVRKELEDINDLQFNIIQAQTGTAKTKILEKLSKLGAQVLNLEELANHRGSLLGRELNQKQPSQKLFETHLHAKISNFNKGKLVFLESESSKIGNIHLPKNLWEKIVISPRTKIISNIEARVIFLLKDYKHLIQNPDLIKPFINGMKSKYSKEIILNWQMSIKQNKWSEFVRDILEKHYDPSYKFSEEKYSHNIKNKFEVNNLSTKGINKISQLILKNIK